MLSKQQAQALRWQLCGCMQSGGQHPRRVEQQQPECHQVLPDLAGTLSRTCQHHAGLDAELYPAQRRPNPETMVLGRSGMPILAQIAVTSSNGQGRGHLCGPLSKNAFFVDFLSPSVSTWQPFTGTLPPCEPP